MTAAPEVDREVGMEIYASGSPPCKALLRSRDEDFVVEEALAGLEVSQDPFPGSLPLYRVEKHSLDTFHLERAMSDALKSRVTFAGIKDKRAAAVQFLTPTSTKAARPERVQGDRFTAVLQGYVSGPIRRRHAWGNRFRIVLRDCCAEIGASVEEAYALGSACRLPNFFGLQRFGARDPITHLIGRSIVQRKFKEAAETILLHPRKLDGPEETEARELMAAGRYDQGWRLLPAGQDTERAVGRRLASRAGDYIGALRAVPIRLRRFYVHAYQSYIFNRTISLALESGVDISRAEKGDNWAELAPDGLNLGRVHGVKEPMTAGGIPVVQLVGYAYRDYGSRFDRFISTVMEGEGVRPGEFFVEGLEEVSSEGGFRRPHLVLKEPIYDVLGETAKLEFSLPRGGYATTLLREVVKPDDPVASGFA